jgi:hypothetical protein
MSNAQRWERKVQRRDVVDVIGGFLGNGAGTITPPVLYFAPGAWTLSKIGASGTGVYRVFLRDKFVGVPIIMCVVNSTGTTPAAFDAQAGNYQTPATGLWSFDIFVTATPAGTAADLTSAGRVMFVITWSDTKQP